MNHKALGRGMQWD